MTLFEWDEAKAESNLGKHGVDFEDAAKVFFDEFALCERDRFVDGEERWRALGVWAGPTILFVAYSLVEEGDDEVIRIISAREATTAERRRYGEDRTKNLG